MLPGLCPLRRRVTAHPAPFWLPTKPQPPSRRGPRNGDRPPSTRVHVPMPRSSPSSTPRASGDRLDPGVSYLPWRLILIDLPDATVTNWRLADPRPRPVATRVFRSTQTDNSIVRVSLTVLSPLSPPPSTPRKPRTPGHPPSPRDKPPTTPDRPPGLPTESAKHFRSPEPPQGALTSPLQPVEPVKRSRTPERFRDLRAKRAWSSQGPRIRSISSELNPLLQARLRKLFGSDKENLPPNDC
ncbi:PREDICTED: proline-rich receptor-like protein kinase PERK2 [Wasmannia auropunctata]|uniref:proline-rich receptor-like protein kinase PERK2 n=1 Tax=Wasmannia auropunctata TaxID=64793 RepID=UPI0005EDFBCF|nr:PREDICTED: proline-rich receptor-like protein kinase PERK2 [Wasmannia auropunctata]